MLDGKEQKEYDEIGGDNLVFSPDGRRFAYGAQKGEKWLAVVDGKENHEYTALVTLLFSPDSRSFAFAARRGDKVLVVVEGREEKEYDGLLPGGPVFSPDSRRLAYIAGRGEKRFLVVDGTTGPEFEGKQTEADILFSGDSKHVALIVRRDGKWFVLLDGTFGQPFDGIAINGLKLSVSGSPCFSALRNGQWFAIVGQDTSTAYSGMLRGTPTWSPNGKRVLYAAVEPPESRFVVLVDGRKIGEYLKLVSDSVRFSPDSRRFAFSAWLNKEKAAVMVDGKAGTEYDGIAGQTVAFSDDSKHIVYLAVNGGKYLVVVNEQPGSEFDGVIKGGPAFVSSTAVEYLAFRGKRLFRVRHVLSSQ